MGSVIAATLSPIFTVEICRMDLGRQGVSCARGRIVSRRKLAGAKVLLRISLGTDDGLRETDAAASVRVHILETRDQESTTYYCYTGYLVLI